MIMQISLYTVRRGNMYVSLNCYHATLFYHDLINNLKKSDSYFKKVVYIDTRNSLNSIKI